MGAPGKNTHAKGRGWSTTRFNTILSLQCEDVGLWTEDEFEGLYKHLVESLVEYDLKVYRVDLNTQPVESA